MEEVKYSMILLSLFCATQGFPEGLKKCKLGDESCYVTRANEVLKNKEFSDNIGLRQIDPLFIEKMDIEQGGNASVAVDLKFRKVNLVGLSKAVVYKVSGFQSDPDNNKIEIRFKTPLATILGPYQINGRVLLLPIQGIGNVTMNLENLDVTLKFLMKKAEKDGKTFVHIEKSKFRYTVKKASMNFSNLFNGDKALGDSTNSFLTENWKTMLEELSKPITTSFNDLFRNLFNDLFKHAPYDELFEK